MMLYMLWDVLCGMKGEVCVWWAKMVGPNGEWGAGNSGVEYVSHIRDIL